MSSTSVNRARFAWLRIARRELRGGVAGFWIYLACLALGAWAIAASGSITQTFAFGLDAQSHRLLGGDAGLSFAQREANPDERAWMEDKGKITRTASLDMMAVGPQAKQSDVRAVDSSFPLLGEVVTSPAMPLADALAERDGVWGVVASQSLIDQVGAKVGERFKLGGHEVEFRALLVSEPDRLGQSGMFQPYMLLSIEALRDWGELAPGRLFRTSYRLLLKPEYAAADFEALVKKDWPDSGMRYRSPEDAVDGLRNLLELLDTFMSMIGIAALIAGGVGVAQATTSFLETRVESIATLKALGADAGTIRAAYALQLAALAGLGALIGVVLGALSPFLLNLAVGDKIPLPPTLGLYPGPLLKGFVLSLLAAVMFAAPALGRARATPPAALFRRQSGEGMGKAPWLERGVAVLAAIALAVIAITSSSEPVVTGALLFGAGLAYLIFAGAAGLIKRLARIASRGARGYLRLALANLGGPGSLAPVVAPALGIGLALMTLIAVVQTNLLGQIRDTAPANAPSIIFRQVPYEAGADFDAMMKQMGVKIEDANMYRRAPFILGRVISLKGKELQEGDVAPEERWVTRGETGMTYLGARPPEALLRSGKWWPADYSGPLLVSVEEGASKGLRLRVGDKIGFRIFGRELDAEVASIRKVDWGGFGIAMPFILSPGTLEAAKPFQNAIIKVEPEKEDAIVTAVAKRWPGVLSFQLRRTLETAADLFSQVALVVTALASVVTTAGVLVLFGAFAAAARRRRQDSALLKVFGGSRPAILGLYAFEFALAGLAAALLGAGMGIAAAHPIVIVAFEAQWRFALWPVIAVGGFAVLAAAAGGAAVGWSTLSHRPARVLRSA